MNDLVKLTGDKEFPIEYYSMGKTKILTFDLAVKLRDELTECIDKLSDRASEVGVQPEVSLRLRHKYSGDDSRLFWELVNSMGERKQEFYSLGVVLQNLERWILTQMKSEAPNFVENEQASN